MVRLPLPAERIASAFGAGLAVVVAALSAPAAGGEQAALQRRHLLQPLAVKLSHWTVSGYI